MRRCPNGVWRRESPLGDGELLRTLESGERERRDKSKCEAASGPPNGRIRDGKAMDGRAMYSVCLGGNFLFPIVKKFYFYSSSLSN